ncbi:three-helix bundle dimerization domain-containing protein [Microbacterium yannicii]|uniref:three-helix bundle dimerization domain-containing protein n=1 Tax=Microbacterium yannicii TaxID=671622 RepID=UPI0002DAAE23|nr:hypothetical protein [Microbacterium yannicii]
MENSDAPDQHADAASLDPTVDRVATRYPNIDRNRIESLVSDSAHSLDGAHVRDFIPVLVEHEVMDQLRREADPVPVSELNLESTLVDDPRPQDPRRPDPQEVERDAEHIGLLHGDLGNN